MKPIKDCGWVETDGTCGLPSNLTPECHIDACPRLALFIPDLLAACKEAKAKGDQKIHTLVLAVESFVYLEHVDPPASWEDRHTAQEKMEQAFYNLKPDSSATMAGDYERFKIAQAERADAHQVEPRDRSAEFNMHRTVCDSF